VVPAKILEPGSDVDRLDSVKIREATSEAPRGKPAGSAEVGSASVVVRDISGEELPEAPGCAIVGQEQHGQSSRTGLKRASFPARARSALEFH
jgi:hypothetical protein